MKLFDSKIIDFVKSRYNFLDLKNIYLIGIQHIAPSSVLLYNSLLDLGMPPYNIALLGKCYSSNPIAWHELRQKEIFVSEDSFSFDSHEAYDHLFLRQTKKFVQQVLADERFKNAERIVLVDDGGTLLKECESLAGCKTQLIGVEQTTSGIRKIENSKLHFPVINVARSKTKLNHESRFIARMLLTQLFEYLGSQNVCIESALILGGGYIGRAIHRYLSSMLDVDIFDSTLNLSHLTREELERKLPTYDLIIGCVGNHSFMEKYHQSLKENVFLVSASSSDREFNAVEIRKKINRYFNCHLNINVDGINLLNTGFPFNFNSRLRDTYELELTRGLLLAGILHGASKLKLPNKLVSLDNATQKEITSIYLHSYQKKSGLYVSDYEFECFNTYKPVKSKTFTRNYFNVIGAAI